MLSRQCRARLSYRKYTQNASRTICVITTVSLRPKRSPPRPPLSAHLDRRYQTRHYAQSATPKASDPNPLPSFSHHPSPTSAPSDLPSHLQNLQVHLAASLLPLHQPLTSPSHSAGRRLSQIVHESEDGSSAHTATFSSSDDDGLGESVIGIVSPFEGGECYNRNAILETAGHLGADVLRIDLALAIGLSESLGIKGTYANLLTSKELMTGAPRLPDNKNPMLADEIQQGEIEEMEEDMDFPGDERSGHVKIPVMTLGAMPTQARSPPGINIEWVTFFHSIIDSNESDRPLIILLESCATMLPTFPMWWPSFAQVVRSRRRQSRPPAGRKSAAKSAARDLAKPTAIVLSCAPSLLSSHTGMAHSQTNLEPQEDDGANWWGSVETDSEGRKMRDNYRLETLRDSELE